MTLSTPVKIVVLAALAVALGLGGLLLLTHKGGSSPSTLAVPPVHHVAVHARAAAKPRPAPISLAGGLPPALHHALLMSREVVAVVYSSNVATDRAVLTAARAGAHAARVGFVSLNVFDNRTATAVSAWTSNIATPTVYVVQRPGNSPVYSIVGPTDPDTVAQAALAAR
jgi:hypothetical protein